METKDPPCHYFHVWKPETEEKYSLKNICVVPNKNGWYHICRSSIFNWSLAAALEITNPSCHCLTITDTEAPVHNRSDVPIPSAEVYWDHLERHKVGGKKRTILKCYLSRVHTWSRRVSSVFSRHVPSSQNGAITTSLARLIGQEIVLCLSHQ